MDALEFANYIVDKQINEGKYTNTISLQKILYFVNARFMEYNDSPNSIFEDQVQKWKYGPVVPEVYQTYKLFGPMDITSIPASQAFFWDEEEFLNELYQKHGIEKNTIDQWINEFVNKDRFELVDLTHEHNLWKKDSDRIKEGYLNITYDNNELFNEIKSNPNRFFNGNK